VVLRQRRSTLSLMEMHSPHYRARTRRASPKRPASENMNKNIRKNPLYFKLKIPCAQWRAEFSTKCPIARAVPPPIFWSEAGRSATLCRRRSTVQAIFFRDTSCTFLIAHPSIELLSSSENDSINFVLDPLVFKQSNKVNR